MKAQKYNRCLAFILAISFYIMALPPVSFAAERTANICTRQDTQSFADKIAQTTYVSYEMDGETVIEQTRFIDFDGSTVIMYRSVEKNGTGELVYTDAGVKQTIRLENQNYDMFLKLATSKDAPQTRGDNVGQDVVGSQYKHIFVSNLNYTMDNSAINQILVGGVAAATSFLISELKLPGKTAVDIGAWVFGAISSLSPSKFVFNQTLYEVHFSFDNRYYTHCYHEIVSSYDSGGHLIDTTKMYMQSVGG